MWRSVLLVTLGLGLVRVAILGPRTDVTEQCVLLTPCRDVPFRSREIAPVDETDSADEPLACEGGAGSLWVGGAHNCTPIAHNCVLIAHTCALIAL